MSSEKVKQNMTKYLNERKEKQPVLKPTFGSVFKNPLPKKAGQLVDSLGFKGNDCWGALISNQHANFFENIDSASFDDTLKLIKLIQNKVYTMYNIKLECEVQNYSIDEYKNKRIAVISEEFHQSVKFH